MVVALVTKHEMSAYHKDSKGGAVITIYSTRCGVLTILCTSPTRQSTSVINVSVCRVASEGFKRRLYVSALQ